MEEDDFKEWLNILKAHAVQWIGHCEIPEVYERGIYRRFKSGHDPKDVMYDYFIKWDGMS